MGVATSNIQVAAEEAALRLGYRELKDLQFDVNNGVLAGNDVFTVLPTGFGKSLCYGCLPIGIQHPLSANNSLCDISFNSHYRPPYMGRFCCMQLLPATKSSCV